MSKLRKAAQGEDCTIRIPGVCTWNREETVLCHMNGAGLALKDDDTEAAFGCYACHCAVDGKPTVKHGFTKDEIKLMFFEGCKRTRERFRELGLIPRYRSEKQAKKRS